MKTNTILNGDALQHLKEMPNESINCIMTSPPYWALRDYGIEGQLGLEPTFDEYINKLCDIFDEVKRVLRKDGTCWVNLGDTYGGSGAGQEKSINSQGKFTDGQYFEQVKSRELKAETTKHLSKSLIMIPFRFAIEMVNRGWILRNTIIWHKPNCMPSSIKDRFTVDFEYLFFFVKNKKYWFETQYEPYEIFENRQMGIVRQDGYVNSKYNKINYKPFNRRVRDVKKGRIASSQYRSSKAELDETNSMGVRPNSPHYRKEYQNDYQSQGRNKRTVWKIPTQPFPEAHFAVYPEAICEIPIKAGCPEGGIVLDPFFGAGTTGVVALKQNKQFIGIELNQEYIEIAKKRLKPYLEQTKLP